jgi:hypothetical protein
MRNIGMAILAAGLLVGVAGAAMAQEVAVAVPAPKKEFVVFADRGSAVLSSTAMATVRSAASEASAARQVVLTGRAENIAPVRSELIRQGVAPQAIVVKQEARAPIAKTMDGLADPIDRRVEIRF